MKSDNVRNVTVIYFDSETLELNHHVGDFPTLEQGRVVLSEAFKKGKSIIAVCEGDNQPLELEYAS
ncbi:TIGR02922 family protein [Thalassotalea sp. HSM 43]|uniref:TIGR02922 family protein n=1 Tax=Thalassotalea sp. HSM 43 TaxID=2552945 RepID=UPI001082136B|nr:TIGR02922 family protein [Thalassotalea sp. HSM 43]QBY03786.1 TIGR02922 family protein [Thalassotalea sp. HSM 43]